MQDIELFQSLLGLEAPWTVVNVELDTESEEIHLHIEHPRGTKFCCPECQQELACYDHTEERRWRHLDSCHSLLDTRLFELLLYHHQMHLHQLLVQLNLVNLFVLECHIVVKLY